MGLYSNFLKSKSKVANEPLKTDSYIGKVVDVGLEAKETGNNSYADMLSFAIAFMNGGSAEIHVIKTFRSSRQVKQLYDIASDFAAVLGCTPETVTAGILRNKFFLFHIEECRAKNGSTFNKIKRILCADTQEPDYKVLQMENFSFSFSHELSCLPEMPIVDIVADGRYSAVITSSEIKQGSKADFVLLSLSIYSNALKPTDITVSLFDNDTNHQEVLEYLDGLAQNEDELRGLEFTVELSFNDGYYTFDYLGLVGEDDFDELEECDWEV